MENYAIYLRKSRADLEAEARGEGETLSRHRMALRALAERRGLNVLREYAELVTGDSIAARPQMQALLDDVKSGMYAGVIVNDIDRLGRGDSIDQEIIKYAFVAGNCIIITPGRDINPASPSDEDMLDFSMFFARFEYRKISQRMKVGRTRSAQAGNYIASTPPYGYKRSESNHLKIVPDEDKAVIVRMIFDWYSSGDKSLAWITNKLNEMGIRRQMGGEWDRSSVKYILRNPVYTGRLVWGRRTTVSSIENGTRIKKRIDSNPIVVENTHEAIVAIETFNAVQSIFDENMHVRPVNTGRKLSNPLAGLLYCSQCGKPMLNHGRRGKEILLTCMTPNCPTMSVYASVVMEQLIDVLKDWCATYKKSKVKKPERENSALEKQKEQLQAQLSKAQELVETGVYSPSEYLNRKKVIENQITAINDIINAKPVTVEANMKIMLPEINKVIEAINYTDDAEDQNSLLKTIVARIDYTKLKRGANKEESSKLLKLVVYPKLGRRM